MCYPSCIKCPDIDTRIKICDDGETPCADGSQPMCQNNEEPVAWVGNNPCSSGIPLCQNECAPICLPAKCDACNTDFAYLKFLNTKLWYSPVGNDTVTAISPTMGVNLINNVYTNSLPVDKILITNGLPIHPIGLSPTDGGWKTQSITNILSGIDSTPAFTPVGRGACPLCTTFKMLEHVQKGSQFWKLPGK